jgi:2-keto-4-pentenoate hydratase/2-oxohepta-3-ene-1,7-dioic acid hydratase in catechol pathway
VTATAVLFSMSTAGPPGVGVSAHSEPSGDTVTVEIDRIGRLTNPVAEEA